MLHVQATAIQREIVEVEGELSSLRLKLEKVCCCCSCCPFLLYFVLLLRGRGADEPIVHLAAAAPFVTTPVRDILLFVCL